MSVHTPSAPRRAELPAVLAGRADRQPRSPPTSPRRSPSSCPRRPARSSTRSSPAAGLAARCDRAGHPRCRPGAGAALAGRRRGRVGRLRRSRPSPSSASPPLCTAALDAVHHPAAQPPGSRVHLPAHRRHLHAVHAAAAGGNRAGRHVEHRVGRRTRGRAFRVLWTEAPRWLYTPVYIAMGWARCSSSPTSSRMAASPWWR